MTKTIPRIAFSTVAWTCLVLWACSPSTDAGLPQTIVSAEEPWELVYHFADDRTAASGNAGEEGLIGPAIRIQSSGRVTYSATHQFADSNAASKELFVEPAQVDALRQRIEDAASGFVDEPCIGGGAILSGVVHGSTFHMPVQGPQDNMILDALAPLMTRFESMPWSYDPFGWNGGG